MVATSGRAVVGALRPATAESRRQAHRQQLGASDIQRLRRRVAVFRRVGLIGESDPRLQVRRAVTAGELKAAYTLVHQVFLEQGYITEQPGGIRIRIFEALPEMATFVALEGQRVVGVMGVVPDSSDPGLPSDKAFSKELGRLRARDRRVGEITNLAVAPDYRNSIALLELCRCCFAHAANIGLDDLFISICPSHGEFFQTILQFDALGDVRNYGDTTVDMVEGKCLDVRTAADRARRVDQLLGGQAFLHNWFFAENPHFAAAHQADPIARRRFLDADLLRDLFVRSSDLLGHSDPRKLQVLRRRWGQTLYGLVTAAPGELASRRPAIRPAHGPRHLLGALHRLIRGGQNRESSVAATAEG